MNSEDYVSFDPKIPKFKPYFTKLLITSIILMYFVEILFNAIYSEKAIIMLGAKWNEGITNGEFWRFFTPTILHGNLMHLFLNVIALHIFAYELESIYGLRRFIMLCLISSWGATLASYMFSKGVSIGASGVVFGIIGGLIIFFFKQREKVSGANIRFKAMYTLVLLNLALGLMIPKIDNAAHLGGLAFGLTCGWFISPEYKIEKDEELNKLIVIQKKDKTRIICGLFLIFTVLFWLTKISVSFNSGINNI